MKKIFLSALLLASVGTSVMFAKKDKKEAVKQVNPASSIQTANDTVLYAYGVSLAEQGLQQYLLQLKVIADTTEINSKYSRLIADATNPQEKTRLEKELKSKLDSTNTSNAQNMTMLLKGINERMQASEENFAYARGLELGDQLNKMSAEFSKEVLGINDPAMVNKGAILQGMTEAIYKQPLLISNSNELVQAKVAELQTREQEKKKISSAEVIDKGNKFMAENATKPGVVTLPDGLQYKIIKKGTGAMPTANDKVKVHYHGTLIDGTVFDSSVDRGEPITFGVSEVIKGWTEALQLMPVGSKWTLYIPYNLAYGDRDGGPIPAYSNLIFDVELLDIEK